MNYYGTYYTHSADDELRHFGIPGMKWGVRKDQNVTRATDEQLATATKRMKLEETYRKSANGRTKNRLDASQKILNNGQTAVNQLSSLRNKQRSSSKPASKDLSKMTDKELRDAINRKTLENQYRNIVEAPTTSKGKEFVDTVIDYAGPVLGIAASAVGIAAGINQLKNS